jgi:glutamate dehydrogenase/leucine dehydrogenase
MVDEYQKLTGDKTKASFTGKSVGKGGSLGREAATGRGGVIVLREILNKLSISGPITYGVQGFGNVGSFFGLIAEEEQLDWRLIAATDTSGGIYDENGLSAKDLDTYKKSGNKLIDYPTGRKVSNEELIGLEIDVLVPAALEDAITDKNASQVRAKFILELANGPVSYGAYKALNDKGVIVIPDILANAGGVIVSYLEWLQNKKSEHWPEDRVNKELERILVKAVEEVYKTSQAKKMTLKEAAFAVAIGRLTGSAA